MHTGYDQGINLAYIVYIHVRLQPARTRSQDHMPHTPDASLKKSELRAGKPGMHDRSCCWRHVAPTSNRQTKTRPKSLTNKQIRKEVPTYVHRHAVPTRDQFRPGTYQKQSPRPWQQHHAAVAGCPTTSDRLAKQTTTYEHVQGYKPTKRDEIGISRHNS